MISNCPGALKFRQPEPEIIKCPSCGEEVEIWTDEVRARCRNCNGVVTRQIDQSCLEWCKYARECVGDKIYNKYMKNKTAAQSVERGSSDDMMDSGFTIERENTVKEIKRMYLSIQNKIQSRLDEFNRVWKKGSEEDILAELVFCILTPQSKAKSCWAAVESLLSKKLLLKGDKNQITAELGGVRFKNKKAEYVIRARKQFSIDGKVSIKSQIGHFSDAYRAREWLVQNVKGMGYKEASHFLRNIGFGENLAILDRHVLKNLKLLGIIEEIPASLPGRRYFAIEKRMEEFAESVRIPMNHLDLVLWYKGTGTLFK